MVNFLVKCGVAIAVLPSCSAYLIAQTTIGLHDVSDSMKFNFVHHSPPTKQRHVHLMMGSGIAALDYDLDGWPDLFCGQGHTWDPDRHQAGDHFSDVLYQNSGGEGFVDVSELAGLPSSEYAMGIAVGDYNNDGFDDVYVNEFGRNRLYANQGDGTFREVAEETGTIHRGYGSSCTWADLDSDGNLDLIVVNYIQVAPDNYQTCVGEYQSKQIPLTCHPRELAAERDVLFRNRGDGIFQDMSEESGLFSEPARQGLGVVAADLDLDGDLDFYVANDTVPNQLWINQGRFRFEEQGLISGTALNQFGGSEAGMGVVTADFDGDRRPDLFVTNYFNETNTLYSQKISGLFLDVTDVAGLGAPSRTRLAFGVSAFDADSNGWTDLFVINGHVNDLMLELNRPEPFAQLPQMFENMNGKFRDVSRSGGDYFETPRVGRSSALLDFNRDGRSDLAILHLNSAAALLENRSEIRGRFLQLKLVGTRGNRSGFGVKLDVSGRVWQTQGSSGYLSSDEHLRHLGLPEATNEATVRVTWPSGLTQEFPSVSLNSAYFIVEGAEHLYSLNGSFPN